MNTHRKLIAAGTIVGVALAVGAGTAAAHNPTVAPGCTGITVTLTQYESGDAPGHDNNQLTLTIDGHEYLQAFDTHATLHVAWPATVDHVWSVVVDANKVAGDPTKYDYSADGTQVACASLETSTTSNEVTPTTTAPAPTTSTVDDDTPPVPSTDDVPTTTAAPKCMPPNVVFEDGSCGMPYPDAPTTTTAPQTAVVAPVVTDTPSPSAPPAPATGLPATGADTHDLAWAAGLVLVAGLLAVTTARRKAPRS